MFYILSIDQKCTRVSHLGLGGVCVAILLFVGDVAEHVVVVGVVHPLLLHFLLGLEVSLLIDGARHQPQQGEISKKTQLQTPHSCNNCSFLAWLLDHQQSTINAAGVNRMKAEIQSQYLHNVLYKNYH